MSNQVNKGDFWPSGVRNPELIFLKFGKNDYVSHATLCAKNGGRPLGPWPEGIGEVVRSRAF